MRYRNGLVSSALYGQLRGVDDDGRERTRERLGYLDAFVAAQERRQEVLAAVEESEDLAEAVQRLMALLQLEDEAHAMVVLDSRCGA